MRCPLARPPSSHTDPFRERHEACFPPLCTRTTLTGVLTELACGAHLLMFLGRGRGARPDPRIRPV